MFNRRALCEFAEEEISRARRENRPVSLVLMDLDHFKQVNDEHGHLFGDQALCLVANIISRHKRDYDKAGRWGGEEFLLVLPGTNKEEACQVAERLRAEIASAKLQLPPNEGYLSIHGSFGVSSSSPGDELTFDRLIQQADEALYCAKRDGRNRVYPRPENELPAS
jgi:two-component system chemotaxis response regulator CheY